MRRRGGESKGRDHRLDGAVDRGFRGGACTVCGRSAIRRDALGRCVLEACRAREPAKLAPTEKPKPSTCQVCGRRLRMVGSTVCAPRTGRRCWREVHARIVKKPKTPD